MDGLASATRFRNGPRGTSDLPHSSRDRIVEEVNEEGLVWVALTVIPRKEGVTAKTLRLRGYDCFLPLYSVKRRWSDRIKTVELPLFPGYVFCRLNPLNRLPILKISSVMGIAGSARTLEPVPDEEIVALQAVCRPGNQIVPYPFLMVGARVRIQEGPFKDLEGILLEEKPARLVLSVVLLQRSLAINIDREWVAPVRTYKEPTP